MWTIIRHKGAGSLVIMNSVPVLAEKPPASTPSGDKLEFEEEGAKEMMAVSHCFISTYKKPTVGFEPTTTGLQNQSSTVELRWQYFLFRHILQYFTVKTI